MTAKKTRTPKNAGKKATKSRKTTQETIVDPAAESTEATVASANKKGKAKSAAEEKRLSALDAAAKVLGESDTPLNTKQMVDAMSAKGYWSSPGGKTPHATLYSAILREIAKKGNDARFKKTERGHFTVNG